jgi:CRP-like cAMP-binding protein
MTLNLLARIPFFTALPPDELDRLVAEMDVVNFYSGDILFREGDPGEHLYVVVSGELEILMAPYTDDELILNLLHAGEYLGEMSPIQPGGLRESAQARGDVILLSMSAPVQDLLQRHPNYQARW